MAVKYSSLGGGSGTGFNVQIGSAYSYATFTQAQPAGAYTIKSSNNYTNWDVYLLDASNNLVAYTGSASIAPTTAFSAIVVVNGTLNDILQFSFASTVFSTATTSQTKAGPFITAFGSSVIPSVNSAVTITGGNFAVGILATFTGTDNVVRACKSVVYTSTSSISVVRPDVLPIGFAPYVLTLTNPSINNPTTSNKNILTGLTVGNAPSWATGTSLPSVSVSTAYSTTVVATDVEGAVTYSYVSGTLPTGLSFNAGTGVISGTYSGLLDGSVSYTIRATDSGGNFIDRTFTIGYTGISGGVLTSDSTYYYRAFTGNSTLVVPANLTVDLVMVAGGGGGGYDVGSGGGAGGMIVKTAYTIPSGNHTVAIGAGGPCATGSSSVATTRNGINTTLGTLLTAIGGGGSGSYNGMIAADGGSGGGGIGTSGYTTGGAALQPSSASGGLGYPGGTGYAANGTNNYSGYAGGGGAGGKGGDGKDLWSTQGDTVYGCGGVGAQVSWITSTYGDPNYPGWFAGGGGASTDTPDGASSYKGWGYGGKGGGGDGSNRVVAQGTGTGGYYYIDGKPNTGGGGGGGGNISGASYPGSNGNNGGPGGSGFIMIRYTKASVGG